MTLRLEYGRCEACERVSSGPALPEQCPACGAGPVVELDGVHSPPPYFSLGDTD